MTNSLDHARQIGVTLQNVCEEKFGRMTVSNDRGQTLFVGATCETLEFTVPARRFLTIEIVSYDPEVVFSFP